MIKADFKRLILWLLPINLRTGISVAWLNALLTPVRTVYAQFAARRLSNLYRLDTTPQVCYLEKMLNDRYDNIQRRVHISDHSRIADVNIFLEEEIKPLYIYRDYENKPVWLGTMAEREAVETDFVVNVPYTVTYNDKEMRALLDSYKLAGKRYEIVVTV